MKKGSALSLIHIYGADGIFPLVKPFMRPSVRIYQAVHAEAVSYTHLDVYKRQFLRFGRLLIWPYYPMEGPVFTTVKNVPEALKK